MTEQQTGGAPLHDGQSGAAPACSVCGAQPVVHTSSMTTRSLLIQVPSDRGVNMYRLVCESCAERALKSLGPGRGADVLHTCTAPHDLGDDTRFRVVAIWPRPSFSRPPYWMGCVKHLNRALDALNPKE